MMNFEFDLKQFYAYGSVLFVIMAVANSYSLYVIWNIINIGDKVSKIAGIFFNILLFVLFIYLYKNAPQTSIEEKLSETELDEAINRAENAK